MQSRFQILARHLAETIRCTVKFEDNATPQTDGKIITLPTCMREEAIYSVLGALLHETGHIRYTDFSRHITSELSTIEFETLNALEDIRIDTLTSKRYPKSMEFQELLVEGVIKRSKGSLQKEKIARKILKGLILKSYKIPLERVYDSKTIKLIESFSEYIPKAINAENTETLVPIAKELIKKIVGEMLKNPPEPQQGQGTSSDSGNSNESKEDNKGNKQNNQKESATDKNQEEEKKESESSNQAPNNNEGDKEGDNTPDNEENAEEPNLSELKENIEELEKQEEIKEKLNTDVNDINSERKELKTARRRWRTYQTKRYNAQRKGEITKEKKYSKLEEECKEKYYKAHANYQKANDNQFDKTRERREIDNSINTLKNNIAYEANKLCGQGEPKDILGFKALDSESLIETKKDVVKIEATPALEEIIKEVLIMKRDQKIESDEGAYLNESRFHDLYTSEDQLFLDPYKQETKTKVAFIIDASGSMDRKKFNHEENRFSLLTRKDIALEATIKIADAFSKAINEGAPADFTIYSFGARTVRLINSEDYTDKKFTYEYESKRIMAGTNDTRLANAVNHVVAELKEDSECTDQAVVILTDANVYPEDINELTNKLQTDGARFIFVGIDINENDEDVQELFGDYNITEPDTANEILERAFLDVL